MLDTEESTNTMSKSVNENNVSILGRKRLLIQVDQSRTEGKKNGDNVGNKKRMLMLDVEDSNRKDTCYKINSENENPTKNCQSDKNEDEKYIQQVAEGLFLGANQDNYLGANQKRLFNLYNISCVIHCIDGDSKVAKLDNFPKDTVELSIPVRDVSGCGGFGIRLFYALELIHNMISNGRSVLVYCKQGVSRSATIVLGHYLLKHKDWTLDIALQRLRKLRNKNVGKPTPRLSFYMELQQLENMRNDFQNLFFNVSSCCSKGTWIRMNRSEKKKKIPIGEQVLKLNKQETTTCTLEIKKDSIPIIHYGSQTTQEDIEAAELLYTQLDHLFKLQLGPVIRVQFDSSASDE